MAEFEKDNFRFEIIDREKHLLYIGEETTDISEACVLLSKPQEKSAWDDV